MVGPILMYAVGLPMELDIVIVLLPQRNTEWRPGPALAAGYLTAHLGLHGWPRTTQLESWEWLLLLIPAAAAIGVAWCMLKSRLWQTCLLVGLAAVTASLTTPSFQEPWWPWSAVMGVSVLLLMASQIPVVDPRFLPWAWILAGSCGLPLLIASANAKFGFLSTALAAASGALWLVTLWPRGPSEVRSAVPVAAVAFPTLFWNGWFNNYGQIPWTAFACLVAAPLAFGLGQLLPTRPQHTWQRGALGLLAVVLLSSTALYLAWPALTAEPAY